MAGPAGTRKAAPMSRHRLVERTGTPTRLPTRQQATGSGPLSHPGPARRSAPRRIARSRMAGVLPENAGKTPPLACSSISIWHPRHAVATL